MTNDDVRRAQQRIQDIRQVTRDAIDAATQPATVSAPFNNAGLYPGRRVLDRISGREGEVLNVVVSGSTTPTRVYVRLDDGGAIVRLATDLVGRPTPPAARP